MVCKGTDAVTLDGWYAGDFALHHAGTGTVSCTGPISNVKLVGFVCADSGTIRFASITCQKFIAANVSTGALMIDRLVSDEFAVVQTGSGSIEIGSGSASVGCALNKGSGTIDILGQFSKIEQKNSGNGKIKIRAS